MPLGSMGPFSPRPMDPKGLIGLQSLTRKQRGRGPGSVLRVLPRHIRLQDADSIDLTYTEKELDQDLLNLLPLRSDGSNRKAARPLTP
jgi:hypothetical protein